MYHNLPNQSLLRNNWAGLSPSLFSNRHCSNRRQDTAVLRLRAWAKPARFHSSAMHQLWDLGCFNHSVLQVPICKTESDRTFPMGLLSGLKLLV